MISLKKHKHITFLMVILLLAAALRLCGINWDGNSFLHPDERWILMVVEGLGRPDSWSEFFSVSSPLNPKFFAYGSFPLYLLKIVQVSAQVFHRSALSLWHLKLFGRVLSVVFDLGTVVVVYQLGKRWKDKELGLLAAFFYATAVFPIQNSHFYTVDIQLTFWCTLALLLMARLVDSFDEVGEGKSSAPREREGLDFKKFLKPGRGRLPITFLKLGMVMGIAAATKITAVFLLFPLGAAWLTLLVRGVNGGDGVSGKKKWFWPVPVLGTALLAFLLLQPYLLIDFAKFKNDILMQSKMSKDALTFPYTIQYVGTAPYWYFLKNLVLWGLGIPLSALFLMGAGFFGCTLGLIKKDGEEKSQAPKASQSLALGNRRLSPLALLLLSWIIPYFLITGSFAVKFMRYLLPLYPSLALLAAGGVLGLIGGAGEIRRRLMFAKGGLIPLAKKAALCLLFGGVFGLCALHLGYILAFLHIYFAPHTRIAASKWINENIPKGSVLAVEHWDDVLPLFGQQDYQFVTLRLYDTDKEAVIWETEGNLERADYIIISSKRLYKSIPRLPQRYPWAVRYYQDLFAARLRFVRIAEFTSYPQINLGRWQIMLNDDGADESFTVYDHPKVIVFKKR